MKLDRTLQLSILNKLSDNYPEGVSLNVPESEERAYRANIYYLIEHGLVSETTSYVGSLTIIGAPTITAAGMDFLADDGGLSAILGVVTVKLHDETIRDLIAARLEDSNLPAEEKTGLLHQLRELRGESIKHLTMKLLDAGLENWPAALAAIQTSLRSAL